MVTILLNTRLHARSIVGQRSRFGLDDYRQCSLSPIQSKQSILADICAKDSLEGVPIQINAEVIMETLFGFELGHYYRSAALELIVP